MRAWTTSIICVVAVLAAACGGAETDGSPPDPSPPAGPARDAAPPRDASAADTPVTAPDAGEAESDQGPADDAPAMAGDGPTPVADEPIEADVPASGAPTPPAARPERDRSNLLIAPEEFPQPDPATTASEIPPRPQRFADFARVALPWLQGRTSVDAIVPLFESWRLPPVRDGVRLHLVDTDGDARLPDDGRSAIVIVFTDPPTEERSTGWSNLVVYEPLPDRPGRFRLAYDHDAVEQALGAPPGRTGVVVTTVYDVTADGLPDIAFEEFICDASGCRTERYVLSREDGHYRRTIVP